MIRNPRYMGVVTEGQTHRRLLRSSGKRVPEANPDPEAVLRRVDKHQRFVDAELWHRANAMLEQRNPPREIRNRQARDPDNRRSGLWPSDALCCGACGGKLHRRLGQLGTRYACPVPAVPAGTISARTRSTSAAWRSRW